MTKLNQEIVETHEKYLQVSASPFVYLLFIFSIILSIIQASIQFKHNVTEADQTIATLCLLGSALMAFVGCLFLPNMPFKDICLYFLHYIVPNRKTRNNEIQAHKDAMKPILKREISPNYLFTKMDLFKDIDNNNVYSWVQTNISNTKGIIKIILNRVLKNNDVNLNLLYWSQVLPLKKLSIDNIRLLLLSSKTTNDCFEFLHCITQSEIEEMFGQYSENDIVTLFTTEMEIDYLVNVFNFYAYTKVQIPVLKDMESLYYWVNKRSIELSGMNFQFPCGPLKDGPTKLGQLEQVSNTAQLSVVALMMKNCINSRKEDLLLKQSYLYLIKGRRNIVFEISASTGFIKEAKYKANLELDKETLDLLKQIIKEHK